MDSVKRMVFNEDDVGISVESITSEDSDGNSKDSYIIKGRAAVFGQRSKPMYHGADLLEYDVIGKNSFDGAVFDHVTLLFNHDDNYPLAVYRSGRDDNSLSFEIKEDGLYYEAELDADDVDVQKVIKKIKNGLVFENSFSSIASLEEGDYEIIESPDGALEFHLNKMLEVTDFSLVTSGQFKNTDIFTFNREMTERVLREDEIRKLSKEMEFMRVQTELDSIRRDVNNGYKRVEE